MHTATDGSSNINTNNILAELENMKTEIKGIADFCSFVSQKFDEINKNIQNNNTFMDKMMNEIEKLKDSDKNWKFVWKRRTNSEHASTN